MNLQCFACGSAADLPSPDFCSCCVKQISSQSSIAAPINTGVKIPTCKFSMKEIFLTSPADLYRVFLNQEVSFIWKPAVFDCALIQALINIHYFHK